MRLVKLFKWSSCVARVAATKSRLGRRLRLPHGGKPVYLGRLRVLCGAPHLKAVA